jgi:hypothetical protein
MKKMFLSIACSVLVASLAHAAKPSEDAVLIQENAVQAEAESAALTATAVATGYRFVSICGVLSKTVCPYGPNPIYFGTGANWTLSQCQSAWLVVNRQPIFSAWPRALSNCGIF